MNPASSDMRFGRIAEALAAPDAHIPAAASAGIDPAELKRALLLFRSAVFAGYFDSEPLGGLLGDLYSILARQSARACAIFRRGEHPDAGGSASGSPDSCWSCCPNCAAGSEPT